MTENQENTNQSECLNCHEQLSATATFCSNCGQKATTGLISLKEFIQNFVDNVFNLDSRIVQTLKWLFIPAKLTQEYFKGRHRTYYHPIRLYLVMSIIFFAALNFIADAENVMSDTLGGDIEEGIVEEVHREKFLEEIDTLTKKKVFFQNSTAKAVLDSLKMALGKDVKRDSFVVDLTGEEKKFAYKDIVNLNGKELVEKYEIEGFWSQILTKQIIHFTLEPASFARQLINNIPLMLLAMMPFLALFMKLLYIRRKRFYVEHLVLNFHHHSFVFLLLTLLFLVPADYSDYFILPVLATILIFLYITMKRYYGQGYFITFLKFIFFNIFYFFSFIAVLVITFIISLLLF